MLWLRACSFLAALVVGASAVASPNVILIVADDLGYGDLGAYGSPTIASPNIDRLASEGVKFTQFYVAAPICTPSRSSMLTGRLPVRNGIYANFSYPLDDIFRVFYPSSVNCLAESEVTLADALAESPAAYSTAMIGKWHLGHNPAYNCLPGNKRQGFDFFFGLPYSHEEGYPGPLPEALVFPPVPLFVDDVIVEQPFNASDLTQRYTALTQELLRRYAAGQQQKPASRGVAKQDASVAELLQSKGLEVAMQHLDDGDQDFSKPFFLHLAYENPHVPLFLSDEYLADPAVQASRRGLYGDAVGEMDRSIGAVMDTLAEEGLQDNTIVIFLSDNGAWTNPTNGISTRDVKGLSVFDGGSNLPFQEGKGSTWEGGLRVPAVLWAGPRKGGNSAAGDTDNEPSILPEATKGSTIRTPVSAMDLFPTLLDMLNIPPVVDETTGEPVIMDGVSLKPLLMGTNTADPHDCLYFWRERDLYALRCGGYKAHFITRSGFNTSDAGTVHDPPVMYNVDWDPNESIPLSADLDEQYETQLAYMLDMAERHLAAVVKAPSLYLAQNFTLMPCCDREREAGDALGGDVSQQQQAALSHRSVPTNEYETALSQFYDELLTPSPASAADSVGIWWDKCVCTRNSL